MLSSRVSLCLALLTITLLPATLAAQQQPSQPDLRQGMWRGQLVTYEASGDRKVLQGDMLLDHVDPPISPQQETLGISYSQYLWPKVGSVYQIPYIITSGSANLTTAISQFNTTFSGQLQFVAHGSETDYVNFNLDPNNHNGICESNVGRIGGEQNVGGSIDCAVGTLLHEMGHTVGLYHEQSRPDRDTYVSVLYQNIIKASRSNFDPLYDNAQTTGSYDYASVMHYIPFAFSRNGGPTLESIPAGIGLSNTVGYTAADIDTIQRIYGFIPTSVTVTTNPPGLQVIVDGSTVTTPQTYAWALNSTHTLNIPSGSQTLSGTVYTYGRWSDSTMKSHSVKVTPGGGTVVQPATSPALTVYTANFIKLLPFSLTVYPTGTGTATASPAAKTYPPATGTYYVDRTKVTLKAVPHAGQNFYSWWGNIPGPSGANPLSGQTPFGAITAAFTSSPVYTVTTSPAGHWLYVDGNFEYGPRNFALPYDSSWTSGSMHTLSTVTPQYPYSSNTRFAYSKWSDKGAITHTVTLAATSTKYTATFTPQYYLADWYYPACAGSLSVSPTSSDGFYNSGKSVSITQTAATGWVFTGWLYDASGTNNPAVIAMKDEELVATNYNTVSTPLAVTSLSPPTVTAGGGPFTLTINGTGFTSASIAFVNGTYRAPTYVSSMQLTLNMTAADISVAGVFQIAVANFPNGAPCYNYQPTQLFVLEP